jgi:preprotein translocase subunit SecA
LQVVDRLWMDHIDALDIMRSGISLRSYGQRDPLVEFKNEAFRMFEDLKLLIQHYIVDNLLRLLRNELRLVEQRPVPKRKMASRSTGPRNLRTNADDIARAAGQAISDGTDGSARSTSSSSTYRGTSGAGARHQGQNNRGHAVNRGATARPVVATQSPRPVAPGRIGRNDPCPCGSGKKYKKCHGA